MQQIQTRKTWREYLQMVLVAPLKLLQLLEQGFYIFRDFLWNYPDLIFFGENSLSFRIHQIYRVFRPYSFFAAAGLVIFLVANLFAGINLIKLVNANPHKVLYEGVIMGIDEEGKVQQLAKINPLVTSSVQLERDLTNLIYEPLFRYEQDGSISNILVENVIRRQEGAEYIFELREDVFWHDGTKFRKEDVISTFNLIQELATNEELSNNAFIKAINQMGWEVVGDRSVAICTLPAEELELFKEGELARPCTSSDEIKPILSNFLELIAVKIMPAHMIQELNSVNINRPDPVINRAPVGTGPFKFVREGDNTILLRKNSSYHAEVGDVDEIVFKLFTTEEEAVAAMKRGEIHGFATVSTFFIQDLENYEQISTEQSPVLTNQYWSLYFNMRKNPDGDTFGPEFLAVPAVRRALNLAVNKQKIIDRALGVGEVTNGPIHESSEFYNPNAKWLLYDPVAAISILNELGWEVGADGVRAKDGERMSFTISYVDNFDRTKTVESLVEDFRAIGVEAIPDPRSNKAIVNEVVSTKSFDTLLYGMRTFIDPDRYELFHSGENSLSNLSSYKGNQKSAKIEGRKTVRLPKIDKLLELGRSLDPLAAKDLRLENYQEFQELIAYDPPGVFLYAPQFIYYRHNRLSQVDLNNVKSIEDRFLNIANWNIN